MKAWRVHELGEPGQVLRLDDIEEPLPGPGQVLVRVTAAALNFPDALLCRGEYQERPPLPFTPGLEVCGRVVTAGDGVTRWSPDDRVLGTPQLPRGGLAELVVLDDAATFAAPDALSDAQSAGLHITYQTAYVGLHRRAALRAAEVLLVHAGAGGVGSAAVQLGKAAGAHVIATAGSAEKLTVCRDLGADVAVNYKTDDVVAAVKEFSAANGRRGADVVFDPVGGDLFDLSTRCIGFEGRLLVVGFASGRIPTAAAGHLLVKNYSVVGLHWGLYRQHEPALIPHVHEELARLATEGRVAPLIGAEVPLADAPDALDQLAAGRTTGKVVVRP